MIKQLRAEPKKAVCDSEQANPDTAKKPRLSLTWEIDPMTGKPVGRWVAEPTQAVRRNSLASAA